MKIYYLMSHSPIQKQFLQPLIYILGMHADEISKFRQFCHRQFWSNHLNVLFELGLSQLIKIYENYL